MTRDTRYRLLQQMRKEWAIPLRRLWLLLVSPTNPHHSQRLQATVTLMRAGLPLLTHRHRLQ